MSMLGKPSLSTTFFDPESEPVPEPEPTPEPPKRRGRPPGAKSKPKAAPKKPIPWFTICRTVFWAAMATTSVVSLYWGVQGWLGQSAAYITLAVSVIVAAFLLDRDWKKVRS